MMAKKALFEDRAERKRYAEDLARCALIGFFGSSSMKDALNQFKNMEASSGRRSAVRSVDALLQAMEEDI